MTEEQQQQIAQLVNSGAVIMWNPDQETARTVVSVGKWRSSDPSIEDEPGLCAYFDGGEYAALYNCEISDFIEAKRL